MMFVIIALIDYVEQSASKMIRKFYKNYEETRNLFSKIFLTAGEIYDYI